MSFKLTPGHIDDRKAVPTLVKELKGWLFGDKGYLGQEFAQNLRQQAIHLFTRVRKNMKDKVLDPLQEYFLSKRRLIETVIDQLKNIAQIEHTRHRNPTNAFVSIIAALAAYQFKPRKPRIKSTNIQSKKYCLTLN